MTGRPFRVGDLVDARLASGQVVTCDVVGPLRDSQLRIRDANDHAWSHPVELVSWHGALPAATPPPPEAETAPAPRCKCRHTAAGHDDGPLTTCRRARCGCLRYRPVELTR